MVSAEEIGNNQDLLTEILIRVPTKPLVTFKCVSKRWLSLIFNPQFSVPHARHHHSQYPTPTALLLKAFGHTRGFEIIPLKPDTIPKFPSSDCRIKESCNGLLLCSSFIQLSGKQRVEYMYYICNPTTKQFKRLSFPSCEFRQSLISFCMAFDPLKSSHYKLICLRRGMITKDNNHIVMYSSETDSWSPLGSTLTLPYPYGMHVYHPVFCNGAVHWYSEDKTSLYFDVDTECFNTMPMPDLDKREVHYFGESRGHLHLIVTKFFSPLQLQFDVLEMAADYSGWFVRYHVNLDAMRIAFPDILSYFSVLDVIRAQKEEESMIVVLVDNEAISFNVHDGTSKKLCDIKLLPPRRSASSTYRWSDTIQYFDSLNYFS